MYFKDFISNCFYLTIVVIYGTQELENDITNQGGVVSHTENQEYHFINLVAVVYEFQFINFGECSSEVFMRTSGAVAIYVRSR